MLATDRARPKTRPAPTSHPQNRVSAKLEGGGESDLTDGSRHCDATHGEEIADREVVAHPKHEQDDADLGELWRQMRVGHEAGGKWPKGHASEQVTDEGW